MRPVPLCGQPSVTACQARLPVGGLSPVQATSKLYGFSRIQSTNRGSNGSSRVAVLNRQQGVRPMVRQYLPRTAKFNPRFRSSFPGCFSLLYTSLTPFLVVHTTKLRHTPRKKSFREDYQVLHSNQFHLPFSLKTPCP